MRQVFLSHSHLDKTFARYLADRIRAHGAHVWIDEAELMVGDSLFDKIERSVREADALLALISRNSVRSDWVKTELMLALSKERTLGRTVVLPVRIDRSKLPQPIAGRVACDLSAQSPNWDVQFDDLIRAIGLSTHTAQDHAPRKPFSVTIPALLNPIRVLEEDCGTTDYFQPTDVYANGIFISAHARAAGRVLGESLQLDELRGMNVRARRTPFARRRTGRRLL